MLRQVNCRIYYKNICRNIITNMQYVCPITVDLQKTWARCFLVLSTAWSSPQASWWGCFWSISMFISHATLAPLPHLCQPLVHQWPHLHDVNHAWCWLTNHSNDGICIASLSTKIDTILWPPDLHLPNLPPKLESTCHQKYYPFLSQRQW